MRPVIIKGDFQRTYDVIWNTMINVPLKGSFKGPKMTYADKSMSTIVIHEGLMGILRDQ